MSAVSPLRDLIGSARTGSGKTLAFLIPVIQLMNKLAYDGKKGTRVLIISPTRELSMQTFGVLKELLKYHNHTHGLVMGGADLKAERAQLAKDVAILVAVPGRLLDHMQSTEGFFYGNCECLVIDEADRILNIGFEEQIKSIIRKLPSKHGGLK